MSEPVEVDDIKAHLRLDLASTEEDDYLAALITAARVSCEAQINRSVIGVDLVLAIDRFPRTWSDPTLLGARRRELLEIQLPGGKVASVTTVQYVDTAGTLQTLDPSTYTTALANRPGRIAPVDCWPETDLRPEAVTISYIVSSLSDDELSVLSHAIRLLVGHWYRNRSGVSQDMRGTTAEMPLAVTYLLEPLRQFPCR